MPHANAAAPFDLLNIPQSHSVYAGLALGHAGVDYPKWIQREPIQVAWK